MLDTKRNKEQFFYLLYFSATLFAKSKNTMLSHLYADVVEEEGSGKAGIKKKGGSMQTISATIV
jgi:hypothetical protein